MVWVTKTQRLIELMMKVYDKKQFTVEELAQEFDVSYRTMLRYLQELSSLGVPLYSEVGKHGGYSLLNEKRMLAKWEKTPPILKRILKPATHVIGLEYKAPFTSIYMANTIIPMLWEKLGVRVKEIANENQPVQMLGVVQNRSFIYHYIAGIEVRSLQHIPEGMVGITLPTKAYAVYIHHGARHREELDFTYFHALDKLRDQNMDHDTDAYCLEIYENDTSPGNAKECQICIPLK